VPPLQKPDQLLEQPPELFGIDATNGDHVASYRHCCRWELSLDLAKVFVTLTDQCRHQVRPWYDNGASQRVGGHTEVRTPAACIRFTVALLKVIGSTMIRGAPPL
jgi:hypothetical protein